MVEGNNNLTGSIGEDGALIVKDGEAEVRYVKEADLLTLKGSKESVEQQLKDLQASGGGDSKEALETAKQATLQAEAKVTSLEEQLAKGTASAAETEKLKADLQTAKTSGEGLGTKLLELQRTLIVNTYGVPRATVDSKDTIEKLEVYAEALASVTGKPLGNYAAGGAGGGGNLQGKSPMELAALAYESSDKK